MKCANCGASMTDAATGKCPYCGGTVSNEGAGTAPPLSQTDLDALRLKITELATQLRDKEKQLDCPLNDYEARLNGATGQAAPGGKGMCSFGLRAGIALIITGALSAWQAGPIKAFIASGFSTSSILGIGLILAIPFVAMFVFVIITVILSALFGCYSGGFLSAEFNKMQSQAISRFVESKKAIEAQFAGDSPPEKERRELELKMLHSQILCDALLEYARGKNDPRLKALELKAATETAVQADMRTLIQQLTEARRQEVAMITGRSISSQK